MLNIRNCKRFILQSKLESTHIAYNTGLAKRRMTTSSVIHPATCLKILVEPTHQTYWLHRSLIATADEPDSTSYFCEPATASLKRVHLPTRITSWPPVARREPVNLATTRTPHTRFDHSIALLRTCGDTLNCKLPAHTRRHN